MFVFFLTSREQCFKVESEGYNIQPIVGITEEGFARWKDQVKSTFGNNMLSDVS